MVRKKYGKLKISILDILNNSESCTIDKIKERLEDTYNMVGVSKANISTAISQMIKAEEPIAKVKQGEYKIEKKSVAENIETPKYSFKTKELHAETKTLHDEMKEFQDVMQSCLILQKKLEKELDYGLSSEEFDKYKKMYLLTKDYINKAKKL